MSKLVKALRKFVCLDPDTGLPTSGGKAALKTSKALDKGMVAIIGFGSVIAFGVWAIVVIGLILFISMLNRTNPQ